MAPLHPVDRCWQTRVLSTELGCSLGAWRAARGLSPSTCLGQICRHSTHKWMGHDGAYSSHAVATCAAEAEPAGTPKSSRRRRQQQQVQHQSQQQQQQQQQQQSSFQQQQQRQDSVLQEADAEQLKPALQQLLQLMKEAHEQVPAVHQQSQQQQAAHWRQPTQEQQQQPKLQHRCHQQRQRQSDNTLKPKVQQLVQQMQGSNRKAFAGKFPLQDQQKMPPPQLEQGVPQAQLTSIIQGTSEPRQLLQVLLAGGGDLNAVHVTALVQQLLRFAQQQQQMQTDPKYRAKVKVCFKRLRRHLQGQLLDLDPRAVASLMRCFAKLGCIDYTLREQGLWGDLLHVSTNFMHDFTPQQLAMVTYAVAQGEPWTGAKPTRHWWSSLFAASRDSMQGFTPQGFANMVWAMGKLQRRPGSDWAAELYATTETQLEAFTPQGLANLGSGLANMNALGGLPRPNTAWVDKFLEAAEKQLEGFSSQGVANLLWSLAKLGYCPSRHSLGRLVAASQLLLPQASSTDLALLLYSFALLQVQPPEGWWAAYWHASGAKLESASAQALANSFWALGRLGKVPPTRWLLAYLPALQQQLPHCSPQAVSNVFWAAGKLRLHQLPPGWLDALLDKFQQQLNTATAQELSVTLAALQQLHHKPSSKWFDRFYAATLPKLPSFLPWHLSASLEALGSLASESPPAAAWSDAALSQVSARLRTMSAPGLCGVMWGVCELQLKPDKDLVARFLGEAAEKMHLMDGAMLSRTLRTLVRFGHTPNSDWLVLLADESHYHLPDMDPEQLGNIAWSFGSLRYSPGQRWVSTAKEVVLQKLPTFTAKALVRALEGFAGLQVEPSVQWLGAVGHRVQQLLGCMTGQELLLCVHALEKLGLGPVPLLVRQLTMGSFATPTAAEAFAEKAAAAAVPAAASVSAATKSAAGPAATNTAACWMLPETATSAQASSDRHLQLQPKPRRQIQQQWTRKGVQHGAPEPESSTISLAAAAAVAARALPLSSNSAFSMTEDVAAAGRATKQSVHSVLQHPAVASHVAVAALIGGSAQHRHHSSSNSNSGDVRSSKGDSSSSRNSQGWPQGLSSEPSNDEQPDLVLLPRPQLPRTPLIASRRLAAAAR